jgi:hypothetical protein
MATLSVQSIVEAGLNATYANAAVDGDTFANNQDLDIFIHVKNGDASSKTVTIAPEIASKSVPGFGTMTKATISVAIPAGENRFIGPFHFNAFGINPDIQYSAVTSVTIAVLRV